MTPLIDLKIRLPYRSWCTDSKNNNTLEGHLAIFETNSLEIFHKHWWHLWSTWNMHTLYVDLDVLVPKIIISKRDVQPFFLVKPLWKKFPKFWVIRLFDFKTCLLYIFWCLNSKNHNISEGRPAAFEWCPLENFPKFSVTPLTDLKTCLLYRSRCANAKKHDC